MPPLAPKTLAPVEMATLPDTAAALPVPTTTSPLTPCPLPCPLPSAVRRERVPLALPLPLPPLPVRRRMEPPAVAAEEASALPAVIEMEPGVPLRALPTLRRMLPLPVLPAPATVPVLAPVDTRMSPLKPSPALPLLSARPPEERAAEGVKSSTAPLLPAPKVPPEDR